MPEPDSHPGRAPGPFARRPVRTFREAAVSLAGALCVLAFASCGSDDPARAKEENFPSNLTLMRSLVTGIGTAVIDTAGAAMGDVVLLSVDSSSGSWLPRTAFASLLGAAGRKVVAGPGGGAQTSTWGVRGVELTVEYRNIRKPGVFSGPVVDRVLTASIGSEVAAGGTILFAGTMTRSITDTVPESRITELESGGAGLTTGKVPDLRSLDRYIEPFVIIGATGVAILLFFQVRS